MIPQPVTNIEFQKSGGKPRLGFIALNVNFLGDLIPLLANDFDICFPESRETFADFANEMDILWFEFACGDVFRELINLKTKARKVVRVHKFELYQEDIYNTNWHNIDLCFFVNNYCKDLFLKRYFALVEGFWDVNITDKLKVLANGIDISRFDSAYEYHKNGMTTEERNTIGFLGYITPVKNLPLALQIFDRLFYNTKIFDLDKWRFKIGGCFLDKMTEDYFYHYLERRKLEDYVKFVGWIDREQVPEFMKSVNYMLCTSFSESQNVSCVEAMASGIRPVIHHFPGAETIWDIGSLFSTLETALSKFYYVSEGQSHYFPEYYRNMAEKKFNVQHQAVKIKNFLNELLEKGVVLKCPV